LVATAEKSQELHQKMLGKTEESKKLREEANSLHQLFVQTKQKAKAVQDAVVSTLDQLRHIKGELRDKEEEEKKKSKEALREKLEVDVREKLKRGDKLTWEEFQLLAGNDEDLEQD
jgi:uncharacterized coiled-coil DUF342 family protein